MMNKKIQYTAYLLFIGLVVGCGKNYPASQYFPDMYNSPVVEPQELDITSATLASRNPPEGTIPIGYFPYEYDSAASVEKLDNATKGYPFPETIKKNLVNYKRGEERFHINCFPCHGPRGEGNGPVVGPPPRLPFPPSFYSEPVLKLTDGQLYHVITKGWNRMPPYAPQVENDDRWKIILYIRKLQEHYAKTKASGPKTENDKPNG
jgi:mono/diheme cytochrome c family protein